MRKLILHFDINKTILMRDSEQGYALDQTLYRVIAARSWGIVEEKEVSGEVKRVWKLKHDHLTMYQPAEGLINYYEFVKELYPKRTKTGDEDEDATALDEFNASQNEARATLISQFPKPGNPGVKFKNHYEKMHRALTLPKAVREYLGVKLPDEGTGDHVPDLTNDEKIMRELMNEGKFHIIPAFFKLLLNLRRSKREFAIVFRSYGTDLQNVVHEFNRLCEGTHPCYNGKNGMPLVRFDGSKGTGNFKITDSNLVTFYRSTEAVENTIVTGTLERVAGRGEDLDEFYAGGLEEGDLEILRGPESIYIGMMELLKGNCGMAISEDYEIYQRTHQKPNSKLLLVDSTDYNVQHIFFDDNADFADELYSIVDPRELMDFNEIPLKHYKNKYVVEVDSYKAVTETDYFIKAIEECEKNRTNEINRREAGLDLSDEEEVVVEKSAYEKLVELPPDEYLMKTVIPLLLPALTLVDIERPTNPLGFVATYMLKNKDKIDLGYEIDEGDDQNRSVQRSLN